MYWIEICSDGSYMYDGKEHSLPSQNLEALEGHEYERHGNEWAKIALPYQIETQHGRFVWQVEIIEYFRLGATSFLGYSLKEFPKNVALKEEVTFCLQDGWTHSHK